MGICNLVRLLYSIKKGKDFEQFKMEKQKLFQLTTFDHFLLIL